MSYLALLWCSRLASHKLDVFGGKNIYKSHLKCQCHLSSVQRYLLCSCRLLSETPWPKAVLQLPFCKEVFSLEGELAFRGPRLRMAIHFAIEGTVAHR